MQVKKSDGGRRWYVIHTKPWQEERAVNNLNVWSIETFNPRFKECLKGSSGIITYRVKSLFPQYIFARFDLNKDLHRVSFTSGISSVVSFGGDPVLADNSLIEIIRMRIGEDGLVRVAEKLKPGDRVLIKSGPFKDFTGIFERELRDSDRVSILLTSINFQSHITVERGLVRKTKSLPASLKLGSNV